MHVAPSNCLQVLLNPLETAVQAFLWETIN